MTSKPLDYIDTWTTLSLSLSLSLSCARVFSSASIHPLCLLTSLSSSCLAKPGLYGHPPVLNSLSVIESVR